MDSVFMTQLILSMVVGGGFVALCTLAAERLGTLYGGFVAGLPSTVVVGLLFIGLTEDPHAAAAATSLIPVMIAVNGLFLVVFGSMLRWGIGPAILGSLAVWCAAARLIIRFFPRSFVLALMTCVILMAALIALMERRISLPAPHGPRRTTSLPMFAVRMLAAGTVVGGAVLGSRLGGPVVGGLLAVFPAVFTTTLAITALEHGAVFARSLLPSLLVSGTINIAVYAVAVRALFPVIGIWFGTLGSLTCSLVSAGATFQLVRLLAARRGSFPAG